MQNHQDNLETRKYLTQIKSETLRKIKSQSISHQTSTNNITPQTYSPREMPQHTPRIAISNQHSPVSSPKPKYYNRWYIPYNQRFIEQKKEKNLIDEVKKSSNNYKLDPLYIYHSLNKPLPPSDNPFHVPSLKSRQKATRFDKEKIYNEMNNRAHVLKKYLDELVRKKLRVPAFLQNENLTLY